MRIENDKEKIYVKNAVDYGDYDKNDEPLNKESELCDSRSIESGSDSNLSSIDEKIINILNFDEDLNQKGVGSNDFNVDGNANDSLDDLDDADFDEELEFICSLGLEEFDLNEKTGIDKDSLEDFFNPAIENCPDELAMLSFFDDFVLVQMSFDDMIKEVYFEE